VTLFEYPLIQISFFLVLNILMIVYLCNKKPFKGFSDTCGQIFCEIILFLVIVSVFLMGLFDHAESYPMKAIKGLSKFIIILNFILLSECAILMLVNIGKMLYKGYQERQRKMVSPSDVDNLKKNKKISNEDSLVTTTTTTKFTRPAVASQNDLSLHNNSEYDNINGGHGSGSDIYDIGRGIGTGAGGRYYDTPFNHKKRANGLNFETNHNSTMKRYSQHMEDSFEHSESEIVPQQRGLNNYSRRLGNHHRIKMAILQGPRVEGNSRSGSKNQGASFFFNFFF